ncbi:MAG TPA: GNAT family N-acetyltransferase [Nocardioidaceae bacterium]|nr:GNAT family N-acetyltransferase [Nocardioidaceae bacterium]
MIVPMFREAAEGDLFKLAQLERDANLAALAHVFPPEVHPFPFDAVLARWRLVLEDPSAVVLVADTPDGCGLAAYAAYDDDTLRHLAVHPDYWGNGLASAAIETALHAMDMRGTTAASLWVLRENHRARRLYTFLGWRETNEAQEAPWPPHPVEVKYTRLIVESGR